MQVNIKVKIYEYIVQLVYNEKLYDYP